MVPVDMRRRRFTAAAIAAIAGATGARWSNAAPAVHTVTIDGFAYKPAELSVARGDTVVWHNTDPVPHTVTAKGVFDSGAIAAGASWTYVARKAGRFDYLCTFHPIMKGRLAVS